jgi:methionyl-tRNA formyltransferase
VTFHHIIAEPDAGEAIHQVAPELEESDGVHDIACKAVLAAAADVVRLLEIVKQCGSWNSQPQRATGKNFLSTDFKAHHLRLIYDLFDDDIVAHYLSGRIAQKTPRLIKQF